METGSVAVISDGGHHDDHHDRYGHDHVEHLRVCEERLSGLKPLKWLRKPELMHL